MKILLLLLSLFSAHIIAQDTLNQQTHDPLIYTITEEQPEFPGGMAALINYLSKNLIYPAAAREAGISGKSMFRFVINEDGSVSNIELLKGIIGCTECNDEGLKLIKAMPKWTPGKMNGKPVKCFFTLPITVCWR